MSFSCFGPYGVWGVTQLVTLQLLTLANSFNMKQRQKGEFILRKPKHRTIYIYIYIYHSKIRNTLKLKYNLYIHKNKTSKTILYLNVFLLC